MAPLFSKVDLNKLWHYVQNEKTLICAKFGKDLFNISIVVGRKIVAQFFWLTVYFLYSYDCNPVELLLRYLHCESKKLGHFFTAYNFRNIEQIFTKFGTSQSLFILNIVPEFI